MTQKPHKFNRYGLLALAVALSAMLANQTPLRATTQDVSRAIRVYWDKDHDGIYGTVDVGLGGQAVELIVYPCDPADTDCVAGTEVLDGVTAANGVAEFAVNADVWGVAGCYGWYGCLMLDGTITFGVQGEAVYLPMVEVAR